jgi:pimeloyl-ACP methyl ester carboxylesterase
MLRQGSGTPLVLLHGILGSAAMWRRVVPLLAPHHDTIALNAMGHRGGSIPAARPTTVAHLVDDAERTLDRLGVAKAHFAGNSLGGWMALELARRGRALSVCALSPAGLWQVGAADTGSARPVAILKSAIRDTRRGRALLPLLARSARFRQWALRANAVGALGVSAADLVEAADDLLACVAAEDLLTTSEAVGSMTSVTCPVTLAWSSHDRIFPVKHYGERARSLVPAARFLVLDGVGHVPMFDDPALVARTILDVTAPPG